MCKHHSPPLAQQAPVVGLPMLDVSDQETGWVTTFRASFFGSTSFVNRWVPCLFTSRGHCSKRVWGSTRLQTLLPVVEQSFGLTSVLQLKVRYLGGLLPLQTLADRSGEGFISNHRVF